MSTIRFRRFTKPQFLREIGRGLLDELFGRFHQDLAGRGLVLPALTAPDEAYFDQLSQLTLAPDGLPENLIEALVAIEEMANAAGQERLERAVARSGLELNFREGSSHGDIAVQMYLECPALLMAEHNRSALGRLSAFEYFGSQPGSGHGRRHFAQRVAVDGLGEATAQRATVEALDLLAGDLDAWFKAHNRGQRTTRITIHPMDREFWFQVRHGDTFARTTKVEAHGLGTRIAGP